MICPFAHNGRRSGIALFCADRPGNQHSREQRRKEIDRADQDRIIQRPGIGDDDPLAASKPQPVDHLLLAMEIGKRIRLENIVRLQKSVELHARSKTQNPAQLRLRETFQFEFVKRQRFESAALKFARGAKPLREIIGNLDNEIHEAKLTWMRGGTEARPGFKLQHHISCGCLVLTSTLG